MKAFQAWLESLEAAKAWLKVPKAWLEDPGCLAEESKPLLEPLARAP